MCMHVRMHVHIFVHLWEMDTEGVTLFKESLQCFIVKQNKVKDKG